MRSDITPPFKVERPGKEWGVFDTHGNAILFVAGWQDNQKEWADLVARLFNKNTKRVLKVIQ